MSQVKEFSSFSTCGKMQESGLSEVIPLKCTSAFWANILCFLILSHLWAHHGEWLESADCWMAGIFCFLPECPEGSLAHCWQWLQLLMTVTSFVYWYVRQYFISQEPENRSPGNGRVPENSQKCWRELSISLPNEPLNGIWFKYKEPCKWHAIQFLTCSLPMH